jgi:hypothetical protein
VWGAQPGQSDRDEGLVLSVGTKCGLFRHYWVLISFLLTIIAAADPKTSSEDLSALGSTLIHSVGGPAVLLVILVLNVYKPRGMTRYGWRKEQ